LNFLNCVALTFAPAFVFYQGTKLAEYNAYLLCVYAALGYVATQAAKLLLLATFLPPLEDGVFQIVPELFKAIINCGDIVGIYLLLNMKRLGDGEIKILGIAVGWATAESLLRRLVPMWLGARQLEFNWEYIQMAIHANINLVRASSSLFTSALGVPRDSNQRRYISMSINACRDALSEKLHYTTRC